VYGRVPPAANIVAAPLLPPLQPTFVIDVVVSDGTGLTETVTIDKLTHPRLFVPVTVYVVLVVGAAVTLGPDVADRPVAGDHANVAAPVAVSTVDEPVQIATSIPAMTRGNGFTMTVTIAGVLHPPLVIAVTVYVVVTVGVAVTLAPDVEERSAAGDHVYETAPVAVSVADEPEHIATSVPALIVSAKGGMTVTVCVLLQELASVMVHV
jgi:PII-like signaling protein